MTFYVLAFLTDGLGDVRLDVVMRRLGNEVEEVFRRNAVFRFTNPLDNRRLTTRVRNFSFPSAGEYQVVILADDEMIAQHVFKVHQQEEPQ